MGESRSDVAEEKEKMSLEKGWEHRGGRVGERKRNGVAGEGKDFAVFSSSFIVRS